MTKEESELIKKEVIIYLKEMVSQKIDLILERRFDVELKLRLSILLNEMQVTAYQEGSSDIIKKMLNLLGENKCE